MKSVTEIPTPAHPYQRREALPWQRPKAVEEDPEAMRRLQAILNSPSYRPADTDIAFLAEDDLRGVRLQIDYLKSELLLREHEIRQAIVVFGSTRISEPAAALRKVQELRALQDMDKNSSEPRRRLAVAERIVAKSHYYEVAREFARTRSVGKWSRAEALCRHRDRRWTGAYGSGKPRSIRRWSQVGRAKYQPAA